MSQRRLTGIVIAALSAFILSAPSHAQPFRAYLASDGTNNINCSLLAPCRLLPEALAVVANAGEIWMLDSANYNTAPVNITKSVTILAVPGALGSVLGIGGNAINIATAGIKVALRNLVIVPAPGGSALNGISMTSGDALSVDGCLVANMPQAGIVVSSGNVRVTDTTIRDNGTYGLDLGNGSRSTISRVRVSGHGSYGIYVHANLAATSTTADIADSIMDANFAGVAVISDNATAAMKVTIGDSRLVRNVNGYGVVSQGSAITLSISNNIIANNSTGIESFGGTTWVSGNSISHNNTGMKNSGGTFESAGNNAVRNNATANTSGVITAVGTL